MSLPVPRSARLYTVLTVLGPSFAAFTGVAAAGPPREHKRLSNVFPNSDLNTRYGVSERIIGPPATPSTPGCRVAFCRRTLRNGRALASTATPRPAEKRLGGPPLAA